MLSNAYIRNGIFYIFSVKSLKTKNNIFKKNLLVTDYRNINIDNFEDLRIAKSFFNLRFNTSGVDFFKIHF